MTWLLDIVGTPTPYFTLDLERENVLFELIPAQNYFNLAIKQQKLPRKLEPQALWELPSPTKIEKPKRCQGAEKALPPGVQECQGNMGFIWKEFSLGSNLKRLCVACLSGAQFEQNRKPTEFGFALVCQYLVSWTVSKRTKYELCFCI